MCKKKDFSKYQPLCFSRCAIPGFSKKSSHKNDGGDYFIWNAPQKHQVELDFRICWPPHPQSQQYKEI